MSGVVQLAVFLHLDYQAHLVHDRKLKLTKRCKVNPRFIVSRAYGNAWLNARLCDPELGCPV